MILLNIISSKKEKEKKKIRKERMKTLYLIIWELRFFSILMDQIHFSIFLILMFLNIMTMIR